MSLLSLCTLSAYMQLDKQMIAHDKEQKAIYDLNDSTNIILKLITSGSLNNILEDVDSEKWIRL